LVLLLCEKVHGSLQLDEVKVTRVGTLWILNDSLA